MQLHGIYTFNVNNVQNNIYPIIMLTTCWAETTGPKSNLSLNAA